MSNSAFMSVVTVVQNHHTLDSVQDYIARMGALLAESFEHYEIILVVNGSAFDLAGTDAPEDIRRNCYVLEFSRPVLWDLAVMAGLQRANGDYVANFDVSLRDHCPLVVELYDRVQEGADIVYARGDRKWNTVSIQRQLFYKLLNLTGRSRFDARARPEFIVSRRALNWITQNRANSYFINETLFGTGFATAPVEVNIRSVDARRGRQESAELAWSAILRSTNFPLLLGRFSLIIMVLASGVAITDALMVRFLGFNIFLQQVDYVPGWAFIVLLMSLGFVMLSTTAYAVMRSIYIIINELRTEPPYTVKRFGRL